MNSKSHPEPRGETSLARWHSEKGQHDSLRYAFDALLVQLLFRSASYMKLFSSPWTRGIIVWKPGPEKAIDTFVH
jgi:hypothetical protein